MASFYWIKLYHEILDDPKMGLLSDDLWRLTIELFLMAGEIDQDGALPTTEKIAWRLRKPCNETLQKMLQALQECNVLALQDDNTWFVTHFAERQKADSSAERVRRFRERQLKKAGQSPKSGKNIANANVTKRYTDIDIDRDKESTTTPEKLTNFYLSYVNPKGRSDQNAADIINGILNAYHHPDIDYALTEAIKAGADSLNYIEAICKRRQAGQPDKLKDRKNGHTQQRSNKKNATPGQGQPGATDAAIESELSEYERQYGLPSTGTDYERLARIQNYQQLSQTT